MTRIDQPRWPHRRNTISLSFGSGSIGWGIPWFPRRGALNLRVPWEGSESSYNIDSSTFSLHFRCTAEASFRGHSEQLPSDLPMLCLAHLRSEACGYFRLPDCLSYCGFGLEPMGRDGVLSHSTSQTRVNQTARVLS